MSHHFTRDLDTIFKVKTQKVKVTRPLCSPVLARHSCGSECGNVLAMGTAATLPTARWRKALRSPWGGEGWGHIVVVAHLQLVYLAIKTSFFDKIDDATHINSPKQFCHRGSSKVFVPQGSS